MQIDDCPEVSIAAIYRGKLFPITCCFSPIIFTTSKEQIVILTGNRICQVIGIESNLPFVGSLDDHSLHTVRCMGTIITSVNQQPFRGRIVCGWTTIHTLVDFIPVARHEATCAINAIVAIIFYCVDYSFIDATALGSLFHINRCSRLPSITIFTIFCEIAKKVIAFRIYIYRSWGN